MHVNQGKITIIEARLLPSFIALNSKLANGKIRDDFSVFAAGTRIKYGIEQSIYHLRSAINIRVAFANNIPVICPADQLKLS